MWARAIAAIQERKGGGPGNWPADLSAPASSLADPILVSNLECAGVNITGPELYEQLKKNDYVGQT